MQQQSHKTTLEMNMHHNYNSDEACCPQKKHTHRIIHINLNKRKKIMYIYNIYTKRWRERQREREILKILINSFIMENIVHGKSLAEQKRLVNKWVCSVMR